MTTITRLLVANRGEIARRVFRTCRDLGIQTVAVHSDADAAMRFVAEADVAVRLPGNTPAETYLRGDLVVEAALRAGADAVHPGYGFLSENADFARRVVEAGLTWVGPTPESIDHMGSKVGAKKIVSAAGVPVLEDVSAGSVTADDLPVLVKASAGGGGRGMRVVRDLADVAAQVAQAADEAASAFGDPTVFVEPYVEHGRHVEVQVVADTHGTVLVLGERDCSIQRRHQKVVEETPAPGLSTETRATLHHAARAAAESVGYVGAGTVEFLLDPGTQRFWFLEMNTRLQVEHPVTECVYGVDLVAMQIAVAEGRPLPASPSGFVSGTAASPRGAIADESGWAAHGHAVEVRLYAEDPAAGWQPQSGRLTRFDVPGVAAELEVPASYGVRLDSGFVAGDEVGTHYDAMLAKVICWAPTRDEALRRLAGTLAKSRIHGLRTNRDLLVNVLRHEAVVAGDVSTDFFDRHGLDELATPAAGDLAVALSAFAAAVACAERDKAARTVQQPIPVGWRNVVSAPLVTRFVCENSGSSGGTTADESGVVDVHWYGGRDGYRCVDVARADRSGADVPNAAQDACVVETGPGRVVLEHDGIRRTFEVLLDEDDAGAVDVESSLGHVALRRTPRFVDPAAQVATGSLLAPMPGTVVSVAVVVGDEVEAGQPVLVLEAMKMQHTVSAPHDGVVAELAVATGAQVAAGDVLAVVSTGPAASTGPAGPADATGSTTESASTQGETP